MVDLIGIQITGLSLSPSLSLDTEFALQRVGQRKAEKSNFKVLNNLFINSEEFNVYINTFTTSKINSHKTETDPHGDRAYASSLVNSHKTDVDPHGDREFTTTSINAHKDAVDPHGDRAYTLSQISSHEAKTDAHGDRAYADAKVIEGVTESKNYTNSEIKSKVTDSLGVTIAPIVNGKVPNNLINKEIIELPLASFPTTGESSILYLDITNNDIYRWTGTKYENLTPEVDIQNITLTTDNVTEGTNPDRKYLTANLKQEYSNKLNSVKDAIQETGSYSLISSNNNLDIKLKKIKTDESLYIEESLEHISITDNVYKYEGTSDLSTTDLVFSEQIKDNIINAFDVNKIYNIFGEISCIAYEGTSSPFYVVDNEKIKVDSLIGLGADTEEIAKPTNLVINEEGTVVTGNSVPNKQVKIYNSSFVEVSTSNVLSSGLFTASLSSAITDGSPLFVYSVDGTYRSKDVKIFTPNLTNVKDATMLSVNRLGLELKGKSEKNSTITILKTGDVSIGTSSTDSKGFFTITLSEAVIQDQALQIKTVTSLGIEKVTNYIVELSEIIAAYEVEVSTDRSSIKGKAEPDSSIIITDNTSVFITETDSSGLFSTTISVPSNKTTLSITVEKDSKEADIDILLDRYINENNKPKEQQKVLSSSFKVISLNKDYLNQKTEYDFDFILNSNSMKISVKNNDNRTTKWIALLTIKEISL